MSTRTHPLQSIERQRFPLSVCDRHTAEFYRLRRVFVLGLALGFGLALPIAILIATHALP